MPDEPATTAYMVALQLPEFCPSDPELLFAQVEALFSTKYHTTEDKICPCHLRSPCSIHLRST